MIDWQAAQSVVEAYLTAMAWNEPIVYRALLAHDWQKLSRLIPGWVSAEFPPQVHIDSLLQYTLVIQPYRPQERLLRQILHTFPEGQGQAYLERKEIEYLLGPVLKPGEDRKEVIQEKLQVRLPEDLTVRVIRPEPGEWHVVIPPHPLDLSPPNFDELEAASGWHKRLGPFEALEAGLGEMHTVSLDSIT